MDRNQADDIRVLNDLSALAAKAFGKPRKKNTSYRGTKTAEERDALIGKLMGPLWGMAWRLARPNHDLAEELRAHVLLKCELGRYNSKKGAFAAWTRTVMTRHYITLVKSKGRAAGGDDPHPEREDSCISIGENDDLTSSFSAADLTRILTWHPIKRVLLLTRGLLWRKLPVEMWANALESAGLPDGFPCVEFEDMNVPQRNTYLAEALDVPRNTIHVRWNRWVQHLHALQFVRDLAARVK